MFILSALGGCEKSISHGLSPLAVSSLCYHRITQCQAVAVSATGVKGRERWSVQERQLRKLMQEMGPTLKKAKPRTELGWKEWCDYSRWSQWY